MGHLLKSVNPEAAERIEDPGIDSPDVGVIVVYRARTGMMRMGRTEFPAIVLGHDDDGFLELFVMMEPEDLMLESHVRPWVEGVEEHGHCWRYVDDERADVDHRLEQQEEKIAALELANADLKAELQLQAVTLNSLLGLRGEMSALRQMILGDYKPAGLCVYDLLAEFEGTLKQLKKAQPKKG